MKLLILKIRLVGHLSYFFFELFLDQMKRFRPILLGLIFLLFLISLVLFYYSNTVPESKKTVESDLSRPNNPQLYEKKSLSEKELLTQIEYWQKILNQQPNSRDALINLSNLKKAQGQIEESTILWNKAKATDPNNPIFTQ